MPVRRWTSQVRGELRLDGGVFRDNLNTGGDGLTALVYHNGTAIYSNAIGGTDNATYPFSCVRQVGAGDTVDLAIHWNSTRDCDGFQFFAILSRPPARGQILTLW